MPTPENLKNLINAYLNNVANNSVKLAEIISRKKSILFLESLSVDEDSPLEYFFNASSQDSESYNSLSIKRIKNVTGNFVYNFFERDEKRKNAGQDNLNQVIPIVNKNATAEDLYAIKIKNSKKSRYIEFNIDMDNIDEEEVINLSDLTNSKAFEFADEEDTAYVSLKNMIQNLSSNNENIINLLTDYIVYEGTLSNQKTTGIEYFDTYADKNAYRIFSSSINFSDTTINSDSLTSSARKFIENLEENSGKFSIDQKKNLLTTLTDLNSKNMFDDSDIKNIVNNFGNINISTKFNNLFISDIINTSTVTLNHIYADEQLGLLTKPGINVNDIQENTILTSNPTQLSNGELNLNVSALPGSLRSINTNEEELDELNMSELQTIIAGLQSIPDIKICGIMITVYEENQGSFVLHDRRIIDNISKFSGNFIYEKIKYGKNYMFEFRTICLLDTIFNIEEETDNELSFALGSFLVLSDKITTYVDCTENISPPAPTFLSVGLDYSSNQPEITWNFPVNPQRDIKKFYVFKRTSLNQGFTLEQVNNFDNSLDPSPAAFSSPSDIIFNYNNSKLWPNKFIDFDFNMQNRNSAIYAVISEDAHGMTSGYSVQLLVKYDKINNRFITETISRSGAPQPYPNLFLERDFFIDAIKQSSYTRCNVFFDPEYYKLFRTVDSENNVSEEIEYIKFTGDDQIENILTEFPYKFHFINIDQQLDQTFEINIANKTGIPEGIPAAEVSSNFTFNFNL